MKSSDAEHDLVQRLERAGIPAPLGRTLDDGRFTAEHAARAWQVFREFGAARMDDLDVEELDDGLLVEGGFDFAMLGGRRYHLNLVRQFTYYDDGEYDHMEQLHCTFLYDPSPQLEAIEPDSLWSFNIPLAEFFARVERMPAFRIPIDRRLKPSGLWLEQHRV